MKLSYIILLSLIAVIGFSPLIISHILFSELDEHEPGDILKPGTVEPQIIFQNIIMNPVPDNVTELQGVAYTWQGYTGWLRFQAPSDVIDLIIKDYNSIKWEELPEKDYLLNVSCPDETPEAYFSPAWDVASILEKECYIQNNIKNPWTHNGFNIIVIDRKTNRVYMCSSGN